METFKTIDECFYLIQNGANIKQGQINGGYPITRIETISNDKFNRDKVGYAGIFELGKYASYVLEDGDLLMSHINSPQYLGRTVLYKKKDSEIIIHGMNLLRLKANVEIINPGFARYLFYSVPFRRQIAKITKKSVNQASFSINDLKKVSIVIPSLSVQEKIVKKLNSAISVRNYYERQIELLDELVKARFVEMFGDPVSNSKDLPVQKMNNVAPICQYDGSFEESVWILNLDMVESQTGRIINYNIVSKDEIGGSVCTFDENNVLYSKLRPYLNKVVIPDGKGYATSELVPLRPDPKIINRIYLAYLLRSNEFVEMIKEKVAGAKMPRVSMSDFREFNVPVPPLELQNQFASFVEEIDKSRSRIQKSLETSQELFDSLMQEYFG